MISILSALFNQAGLIAILAFIISQSNNFRRILTRKKKQKKDLCIIILLFGSLGILGTYRGVPVHGALANSRVVAIFVAGLIGGPVAGLGAGILAGVHRWAIDIGGISSLACMVSTILEGLLGGLLRNKMLKVEGKWIFATMTGAMAEAMQMIIVLILVKPFGEALSLVKIIAIPMICANALAIGIFVSIINSIKEEEDRVAANQAEIVLLIATKTLKYLRQGFNESTVIAAAKIILESTDLSAVAFTSREKILAHVGEGASHHPPGGNFQTELTSKALKSGKLQIADTRTMINCTNASCKLQSAIVIPLFQGENIIGTMKLYREEKNAISMVDINMAKGLGSLFSTQIELSMIEEQAKLLDKAELKALQAQINPHFLFNAINTIVSLVRTSPEEARTLLKNLSSFFRNSFKMEVSEVSIHQEITHIESYLSIEKARFGDSLSVKIKIPDNLDFYLPPFLLQPIVENAVKHGVMEKKEGGEIIIEAKEDKKRIIIFVKDNGIGIPEEKLANLLSDNNNDSIALNNINRRLITKYGEKYGLSIESKRNRGTRVTVCIPKTGI
jgi:two-component system sensor histidine kinase LytS